MGLFCDMIYRSTRNGASPASIHPASRWSLACGYSGALVLWFPLASMYESSLPVPSPEACARQFWERKPRQALTISMSDPVTRHYNMLPLWTKYCQTSPILQLLVCGPSALHNSALTERVPVWMYDKQCRIHEWNRYNKNVV